MSEVNGMVNMVHAWKDRDAKRLIKAARSAGLEPGQFTVELNTRTGLVRVVTHSDKPDDKVANSDELENLI
jgi:hypothetical protein